MRKVIFKSCVGPPFPRFAAKFLQYFSWQLKKKIIIKMGSARIYRQVANVSPHTMHAGLWDKPLFIYFFFSTLGIT